MLASRLLSQKNEIHHIKGLKGPLRAADSLALVASSRWRPNIGLLGPLLVSDISCRVSRVWLFPKWANLSLAFVSSDRVTPKVLPAVPWDLSYTLALRDLTSIVPVVERLSHDKFLI